MKVVKLADVVIQGRQRQEFVSEDIRRLAGGIKKVGLIHAVMLRNDCLTLVAGERRIRALCLLAEEGSEILHDGELVPLGYVPYTTLGECDEIIAQEAELLENALRLDLSWREKDAAILKIRNLMAAKFQVDAMEIPSKEVALATLSAQGSEDCKPHVVQTAKSNVDKAILRDQYQDDIRVQKAKSASDADKIIRKDMEAKHRLKLAEMFKDVQTEHEIQFGDCTEIIKGVADATVDVILSDPIYGIGADSMHMFQRVNYNEGSHHQYDDSWENWDRMFTIMPEELFRVARHQAACYLFCDITRFFDFFAVRPGNTKPSRIKGLATRMAEAGWSVWPRPMLWSKGNIGGLPAPEHGPRYTYECILFATKGKKKTTGIHHDVIHIPQVTGHVHAAGKPAALYLDVLRRSAVPGDTILDFNAGSFPILAAANSLGCKALAWELNEKWKPEAELLKTRKVEDES